MYRFDGGPTRALLLTLTIALCLALAGKPRGDPATSKREYVEAPELLSQRRAANDHLRAGRYLQAIREYQRGYDEARRRGDTRSARRFLTNLGSANVRLLRYRDAVKAYLEVRALAASERDTEALAAVAT